MRPRYTYQNKLLRIIAAIIDFIGHAFFSFRKTRTINHESIRKILVVRPDHIGDNFLMTSFVGTLKEVYRNATIDVMVGSWTREIWDGHPAVHNIILFNNPRLQPKDKEWSWSEILRVVRALKQEKYDLFIDARGEPLTALVGFFARIPSRVGFAWHEALSFLYTHTTSFIKEKNEFEKYHDLLKLLQVTRVLPMPKIYPVVREQQKVEDLIREKFLNKKIIAVHPTSGGAYKIWPTENFVELLLRIHRKHPNFSFAILGGPGEENFYHILQKNLDFTIENLVGKLSLKEVYAFLAKSSLFIGNDSVLAHFAASQNIPTVDLVNVAGGGAERSRPPGDKVFIIEGNNPEHRCPTGNCYPCPNMQAISVGEVFKIFNKTL